MSLPVMINNRFVKSEDLNHHGTLFAGRSAEWFIESGLMAASQHLEADNIVCVKVNSMEFTKPIHLGDIACYESRAVIAGRSSLVVNIRVLVNGECRINGFITYVNVDENGKSFPHGVVLTPETEEEFDLIEQAKNAVKK